MSQIAPPKGSNLRATVIGCVAVLLWALLALFTTWAGNIPPFQLLGMTFSIAFLVSCIYWLCRGRRALENLRQAPKVWILGVGGLFGYHLFYFIALGNAPAVEASLIAYLWPLLIVVFSSLLPGEKLRWFHLAGALMGLCGAVLLVTRGGSISFDATYSLGYLAAIACALIWSGYSVTNRVFGEVPTDVVGGFCGIVAVLGIFCHLVFEQTVVPDVTQLLACVALGLGPVGAAFFVWDYGTKHGNIQVLGAFSYMAPLLSTLVLIAFGRAEPTWFVGIACLLIVSGAVVASSDMIKRRGKV